MTSVMVAFDDIWITDVANPSVSARATTPDRDWASGVDGRFAERAGGRIVVVTTKHRTRTFPLKLQWVGNAAQLDLLESWAGRLLLLRDNLGRRIFGSFLEINPSDVAVVGGIRHTVALTFTEVTYLEGA